LGAIKPKGLNRIAKIGKLWIGIGFTDMRGEFR